MNIKSSSVKEARSIIQAAMEEDGLEPGSLSFVWWAAIRMICLEEIHKSQPASEYEYAGHSQLSTQEMNDLSIGIANKIMIELFHVHTNYK